MDANYLPELCMKEILTNLKNHPSGLLKCSLLNRHWNHYFLPELWKNPFKENLEKRYTDSDKYYNLKNLIKSQKNLKNLNIFGFSISQNRYLYEAIKFQSHYLKNIKFDSIDFNRHCNLSYLIKCKNLEELQFLNCNFYGNTLNNKIINQDERNDYYSDEDEDIVDIDINFQFNNNIISKLNFLKFENCNQFGFYDNQSLIILIFGKSLKRLHIVRENDSNHLRSVNLLSNDLRSINLLSTITKRCENLEELQISRYCNQIHLLKNCYLIFSICGQNLNYLYIRGKEILEITKNVNLLLILSTNCNNLKLLKLSITEKYFNYIPSLFTSCQKLQFISFNNYDQRNLINIDLSKIGLTLPLSLKKFTMKMNLYFTPENFKEFLINIKDKLNLEVLNFKRCELFDNDHLNMLINYNNGNLKRLKINASIKVDYDVLSKANQFLKIENPKLENISLDINQIREMMPIED
ncbi:7756_t:CDS:2 [Rhizophagus irregularis]|nr:7756_t:CDS:2 [Rhizophagus irregularis]